MDWTIWYANGGTIDSTECGVENVPIFGVICINQTVEDGERIVTSGGTFYIWVDDPMLRHAGHWLDVDWIGLVTYMQAPGWKRVLCGQSVSTPLFQNIMQQAEAARTGGVP